MIKRLKTLFNRHREVILYVLFGGLTTVVDWCVSFGLYAIEFNVHASNVIAWCAAVLFAFVTNRVLVFQSESRGIGAIGKELAVFSGGRVVTLLLQEALVFIFFDCIGWNKYVVKVIAAVVVVVSNYFVSKFFVFRKKK